MYRYERNEPGLKLRVKEPVESLSRLDIEQLHKSVSGTSAPSVQMIIRNISNASFFNNPHRNFSSTFMAEKEL
jgi:hypothetical protein